MSQSMSEQKSLELVISFLGKPEDTANLYETLAFQEFHRIHDLIIRARIGRLHKSDAVNDISQDVWHVLIKRLPKFRLDPDLGSVAGWVFKIANDMARRRARHRLTHPMDSLTSEMADELPAANLGPEIENAALENEDELRLLIKTLRATFSERDRCIAVMHYLEGRSVAEIARDLKLTEGCITSVLHRVIVKLRDRVRRRE